VAVIVYVSVHTIVNYHHREIPKKQAADCERKKKSKEINGRSGVGSRVALTITIILHSLNPSYA